MSLHSLVASFKRYRRHVSAASIAAPTTTTPPPAETLRSRLLDVFLRFWDLGFTAFGGPPVHFQILYRRFVEGGGDSEGAGRKWLDEQTYQELFGVCQALPGPASTKMAFCIALLHAGVTPALLAFFLWSLPGTIGMYLLSLGVQNMPSQLPPIVYALLSGLNASTVGIIALAAVQLAEKAIKDRLSRILVIWGACAGLCYNALWYFPVLILGGGATMVGWEVWGQRWVGKMRVRWGDRRRRRGHRGDVEEEAIRNCASAFASPPPPDAATQNVSLVELHINRPEAVKRRVHSERDTTADDIASEPHAGQEERQQRNIPRPSNASSNPPEQTSPTTKIHAIPLKSGLVLLALFTLTFTTIMVLRSTLPPPLPRPFALLANMFLAGTIIFGGGPVVIPLLRSYVVEPGWVSARDFLLGLAVIQALPGPNFNFAVFLGALAVRSSSTSREGNAGDGGGDGGDGGTHTVIGAVLAFLGIFTPGIVLAVAFQSFWRVLRTWHWVLSLVRGINATAVGLVFTAVYRLWEIGYLTPESGQGRSLASEPWWVVVAALAYAETAWFGVPPAVAILIGAGLGIGWWAAVGR